MRNFPSLALVAVFAVALASGCARQTEVVKLYDEPGRGAKTYQRLLVINVSSSRSEQQQFENEIARHLRQSGVAAISGYTKFDSSTGLLQEDIDRVSEEVGADGVLISHFVSVDTEMGTDKGREEIISTCRRGDPLQHFVYDHKVLKEPDSVKLAHTVIVVTNLYDVIGQNRIWTIQSTCFEKSSMAEAINDEARAIAQQLRVDKLI
jgi:hypothetical protein